MHKLGGQTFWIFSLLANWHYKNDQNLHLQQHINQLQAITCAITAK